MSISHIKCTHILSYTVTLDSKIGKIEQKTVDYGDKIEEPELEREGYVLTGWVDDEGNEVTFPYTVTKKVTLSAQWEKGQSFTVTYQDVTPAAGVKTTYKVAEGKKHTLLGPQDLTGAKALKAWAVRPAEATDSSKDVEYNAGEEIAITGNVNVIPVWGAPVQVEFLSGVTVDVTGHSATFVSDAASIASSTYYTLNKGVGTALSETVPVTGGGTVCAYNQTVAEGGVIVIDRDDPVKPGYTFTGWATLEPEYEAKTTHVKVDPETKKPVYNLVPYDLSEPVEDVDGDSVFVLYATWQAEELNVVAYSEATVKAYPTNTYAYDTLVKGLTIDEDVDTIALDGTTEINLSYDYLVTSVTSTPTPTTVEPAIFVKAPANTNTGYGVTVNAYATEADAKAGSSATNVAHATKKNMTIDEKAVPGAYIPVTAGMPYVVLQFSNVDGNAATTEEYLIKLTSYATDEVAAVSVNYNVGTGTGHYLYAGEDKLDADVDYIDVCTLQMPIGSVYETPEVGSLTREIAGVKTSFSGLEVLDKLNKPAEADADGNYAVTGKMSVDYQWGDVVTISFDNTGATNGPQMETINWPQNTVFELPECEMVSNTTGEVFANWQIKVGSAVVFTDNAAYVPGYKLSVTTDNVELKPKFVAGATVTLYSGFGDDTNTSEDETYKVVETFTQAGTYKIPAKIDEAWGWKIPDGLVFKGWDFNPSGYAGTALSAKTNTIYTAATTIAVDPSQNKNYVLYPVFAPEVKFTSSTASYVKDLSTASQMLDKTAYEKDFANLPALTITADDEVENNFIVTSAAPIPWGKATEKYQSDKPEGNYYAIDIELPKDYVVAATATIQTSTGSGSALNLVDVVDKVGSYSEATNHYTWVVEYNRKTTTSLGTDSDHIGVKFTWGNGASDTYTFDVSGLKRLFQVTYTFGGAVDADGENLDSVVVYVEEGKPLTVDEKATAQIAKSVNKVLDTSDPWNFYGKVDGNSAIASGSSVSYDALDKHTVTGEVTMVANLVDKEYTVTAKLGGGVLVTSSGKYDTTTYPGGDIVLLSQPTTTTNTQKVAYGKKVPLPKTGEIVLGGNLLKGWKLNGEDAKPGTAYAITEDTEIEAVWESYLGTLDVAPLSDATDSSKVVVDADTYKVGQMDNTKTPPEFVDVKGKTGEADASNVVALTIKAEDLVAHSNTAAVYGADFTNKYVIGLKVTPPAGATYYSVDASPALANINAIPTTGYVAKYFDVTSGELNNNETFFITWFTAKDPSKNLGSKVTYKITSVTTKLFPNYKVVTKVYESGDDTTNAVTDANLSTQNLSAGQELRTIVLKSDATHYFDDAGLVLDKKTLPAGFDAEITKLDDGKTTQLVITGKVGEEGVSGTNGDVALTFANVYKSKSSGPQLYAADFVFTAKDDASGTLKNNSIYDVKVSVAGNADPDLFTKDLAKNGGTLELTGFNTTTPAVYVYVPATYTRQASELDTKVAITPAGPAPVEDTAYETPVDTKILNTAKVVKLMDTTNAMEYRLETETTWHDVTVNDLGYFTNMTNGKYKIRFKAVGNKLASATSDLDLRGASELAGLTTGKTVKVFQSATDSSPVAHTIDSTTGLCSTLTAGTYVLKNYGVEVVITNSTAFIDDVELIVK